MSNFLTYPLKTMRITQLYTGRTSHLTHTTGAPKDFPVDDGEKDTGRGNFYCPCNEMKVARIYGVGNSGVNTIWLESTSPVTFADGTTDFATILIMHPNDDDLKKLSVGQTFKRSQYILREGSDKNVAFHFHISVGKGKMAGNGWVKNTYGKWVLTTTHGTFPPEQLFFIDKSFTNIIDSKGLVFKSVLVNPYPAPIRAITKSHAGEDVKWVQWELVRLGYNIGTAVNGEVNGIDGHCGPATTQAIKDFQSQHKDLNGKQLVADGQAGPLTRGAMKNV